MRFFGVLLPWQAFLILPVVALLLLGLPFLLVEWLTAYLPEWLQVPVLVAMVYVTFPLLLSHLYRQHLFQLGSGGLCYWFYVAFYCLIGVGETWKLVSGTGGLESALGVCVIVAVAAFLIWSAVGTRERLERALEEADAQAWEDAVQLRAEELKKQRAVDTQAG